jgi:hypothetical protein
VLASSASVAREIRTGTALAVLAKPVGRSQFLLAKYAGLAAALALLTYINLIACLLASRNAFDAYGDADIKAIFTFFGGIALAYGLAGFSNYFLRRTFVSDAVMALTVVLTAAFLLICSYDRLVGSGAGLTTNAGTPFADGVDWRLIGAVLLLLFAIWVIASLALACSTRLDIIPTLAICSGVFLIGLMSDYLLGRPASEGSASTWFRAPRGMPATRWSRTGSGAAAYSWAAMPRICSRQPAGLATTPRSRMRSTSAGSLPRR